MKLSIFIFSNRLLSSSCFNNERSLTSENKRKIKCISIGPRIVFGWYIFIFHVSWMLPLLIPSSIQKPKQMFNLSCIIAVLLYSKHLLVDWLCHYKSTIKIYVSNTSVLWSILLFWQVNKTSLFKIYWGAGSFPFWQRLPNGLLGNCCGVISSLW